MPYDAGSSNWGSVTTFRGGMGWEVAGRFKRKGTYVCFWLIHVDVWHKPTQFYKANILQLQKKKQTQNSQIALSSSRLRRRSWGSQVWSKQHASDLKIPGPTIFLRKPILSRSLVAQWLELCASNVEAMGSIPSQGTRSHMLQPGMHAC